MTNFVEMSVITTSEVNGNKLEAYYIDGEPWFTRAQIAAALGYSHPKYIAKIHERHPERMNRFSRVVKLTTPSGEQNTYVYSERGVIEVCRYSNSRIADMVMDVVAETYLFVKHEVEKQRIEEAKQITLQRVREEVNERERKMEELVARIEDMDAVEYYYELKNIWDNDLKRIDLEMRKYRAMEAAEAKKRGLPETAWVYGMKNRVINDLEKYEVKLGRE